ncbi:MAG: hypothetical protein COB67_00285 [SAR324 cluster bacterium]|uniref:Uncharacterized protein n=1 Tax=SAR324 cluster bacterium TaxID=2024889 RepID=A0A2A4TD96_9DELT|nr:MAG: hypothetical protein COB67_00285 [SAR324 cluster bacterium]
MKKSTITLSLSLILLLESSVMAIDMDDYFLSNSTNAGEWTDPASNKTYYSGGNLTFKFKDAQYYPLWFDGKPPSMKVGCGGISLDGGFIALLDLEDMAKQLSDASGKAAYGVMLSLLSSTPVLARVFENIRKWARSIQNLAQNACEIGKKFGNDNFSDEMRTDIESYQMVKDTSAWYKGAMDGMEGYSDAVDDFVNDSLTDGKTINNKISALFGQKITDKSKDTITKTASQVSQAKMFTQYIPSGKAKNKIAINSTKEFFNGGIKTEDNTVIVAVSDNEKLESDKLLFLIGLRYFGTTAVSKSSLREIANTINPSGDVDAEALKSLLKRAGAGANLVIPQTTYIPPTKYRPEDLVNEILYGIPTGDNKVAVPDYFYIDVAYDDSLATSGSSTGTTSTNEEDKQKLRLFILTAPVTDYMELDYEGTITEMQKAVRAYVIKKGGSTTNAAGTVITSDLNSINSLVAPKIFTGMDYYADIIARIERINNGASVETDALKNRVAEVGSFIVAENIIRGLSEGVIGQLQSSPEDSSDNATETLKSIDHINEISKQAILILREKMNQANLEKDLYDIFHMIEIDLNAKRTKGIL